MKGIAMKMHEFRNSEATLGCYRWKGSRETVVRVYPAGKSSESASAEMIVKYLFELGEMYVPVKLSYTNESEITIDRTFRRHADALGFVMRQAIRHGMTTGPR